MAIPPSPPTPARYPRVESARVLTAPFQPLNATTQFVWLALASSWNTKQIAGHLRLSVKTIEYHRARLYALLRLHDLAALTRLAIQIGLLDL